MASPLWGENHRKKRLLTGSISIVRSVYESPNIPWLAVGRSAVLWRSLCEQTPHQQSYPGIRRDALHTSRIPRVLIGAPQAGCSVGV